MAKFKIGILASIALALAFSFALPAHAAKDPGGMEIKLVPAKKYHGKLPKHAAAEKPVKMKVIKRQSVTMRGAKIPVAFDAKAAKPVVPSQKMEKIAAPTRPVAKAVANADVATYPRTNKQTPPLRRPIAKKTIVKPKQQVASNDTVSATTQAEPDLADSLDRLPITPATAPAPATQALATHIAAPEASAPSFTPVLQFKNRLTTGRKYELETIGGKNFFRKHELFAGAKHSSGWGAAVTGGVWATSYDDTTQDKQASLDNTLIVYHPNWYKENGWDIGGLGRVYFPTSDSSRASNQMQYFYLFWTNYDLGHGARLENTIIPHYFTKNEFADDDTFFLFEEELLAKYDMYKWMTLSMGPYLQVESHERTAPGTTIELEPSIGFAVGDHVYFEPKMYLPIYVDGNLGGGARSVSLSEIAGEFALKISL